MKIVIDGMDGVGKSTLAKLIAKKYNYTYMEQPLLKLFGVNLQDENQRNMFEQILNIIFNKEDIRLKAWLTGLGNIYSLINNDNENVVIDRNIISNYYWNGNEETESIFDEILQLTGFPDMTIILYASTKTRLKRIRHRDKDDKDLIDIDVLKDGYEKMSKFVRKRNIPYIAINTEGKSAEEVLAEIEQKFNFRNEGKEVKIEYGDIESSWKL